MPVQIQLLKWKYFVCILDYEYNYTKIKNNLFFNYLFYYYLMNIKIIFLSNYSYYNLFRFNKNIYFILDILSIFI